MLQGLGYVAHAVFSEAGPPVVARAHRCAVGRTGAGIYTVTIDEAVSAGDATIIANTNAASGAAQFVTVIHSSDVIKTITTSTTTAAAAETNATVSVTVLRAYAS